MGAIDRAMRRVRSNDDGVTLVELIVYMMVVAIVLTLAGTMFVSVARSTTTAVDRRSSTAEAQNILDVVTSDIRAGTNIPTSATDTTYAVLDAKPNSLTLITYTDAGPTFGKPYQVQFSVDAQGRFVLFQWNPPAGNALPTFPVTGAQTVTRYVGSGVSTATPVFSYMDKDQNMIAAPTGGMDVGDRPKVAAVTVTLTVTAPGSSVPVKISNTVWMPNAGLSTAYAGAN